MKIKVTERGAHHGGKAIEVGTVFEIEGDTIPSFLVGKVMVLGSREKAKPIPEGKTAVTNPAAKAPEKEPEKTEDKKDDDPSKSEGGDDKVEDEISKMSDEELSEKFKTAMGKAHHPQMKRENIEAAVREALKNA